MPRGHHVNRVSELLTPTYRRVTGPDIAGTRRKVEMDLMEHARISGVDLEVVLSCDICYSSFHYSRVRSRASGRSYGDATAPASQGVRRRGAPVLLSAVTLWPESVISLLPELSIYSIPALDTT